MVFVIIPFGPCQFLENNTARAKGRSGLSVVTTFFLLTKNANDIQRRKIRETISDAKVRASDH